MAREYEIGEIRALKRQSNKEEAEAILKDIASQVLPIMYKRKWKVKRLHEFFPTDKYLLGMNVNRGSKILVRCKYLAAHHSLHADLIVRPHHSPNSFYPRTELIGTLLHELTHMQIAPHNDAFYALLDELKRETEDLMMRQLSGTSGAAFASAGTGHILGSSSNRKRKAPATFTGSGKRLGGSKRGGKSLRERMAEAAERRRQDNRTCGTAGAIEIIDLT